MGLCSRETKDLGTRLMAAPGSEAMSGSDTQVSQQGWAPSLKNLFPAKIHFVIFLGYMALFVNQGILVTASRGKDNKYHYDTTTAVLLTEVLKLVVAICLQLRESSLQEFIGLVKSNLKVLALYFVPSFLYCLYNNLAFINLSAYDPTTYFLLLQFRVVVTGVIFQILFKKKLSYTQWFSLALLTMGCIIKQLKLDNLGSAFSIEVNKYLGLILVQVFCSCFAGVYNEYLLKGKGGDVPFMIQNVFMYVDSVICNFGLLSFNGTLMSAFTNDSLGSIMEPKVIGVIINNACIGIVTALFLKNLNSILKTFASALEIMFTAVFCWILFGIPIDYLTIIAIVLVSYSVVLYSRNPVDNTPKTTEKAVSGNSYA